MTNLQIEPENSSMQNPAVETAQAEDPEPQDQALMPAQAENPEPQEQAPLPAQPEDFEPQDQTPLPVQVEDTEPQDRTTIGAQETPLPPPAGSRLAPKPESRDEIRPIDHLRYLALVLWRGTQPLHELGSESVKVLEGALQLHRTPYLRPKKRPHQAALELVQARGDQGLSESGKRMLAAVIGYGRGKLRHKDFDLLGLTPLQQRGALTIVSILRIAEGLDSSRSGSTSIQRIEPYEEGMWIVVEGPFDASDAAQAKRQARLWEKLGYPSVEIMLPDQAALRSFPFPQPQENIGILPGDLLSEAGRKVMRYHFAEMLRHEQGTRLGEDIEALHDMRVATRRLRASFEVFGSAFEDEALKPHLKRLRLAGRTLGAVRDMDVFMEKAQRYIRTLPEERQSGLDLLLDHWKEQREAARSKLLAYFDSREYARFKREFNTFIHTPLAGARTIQGDQPTPVLVRQLAPVLIYERTASVRAFEGHLDQAPVERLHMLRIEFKKLRYTVEYFREVLGKRTPEVVEDIKILQDHLGDLNDAQVATQILGEFIAAWEKEAQSAPVYDGGSIEEVVTYLAARHAERHQLMVTFEDTWKEHFDNKSFRRKIAQAISVL